MIATRMGHTLHQPAAERRAEYQTLPPLERLGWVEGELRCLLRDLDAAIEHEGTAGSFLRFAALLAAAHDIPTPALQRAVEAHDE